MKIFHSLYFKIISLEHLMQAWEEFKKEKRKKIDVGIFERHLEDNIFGLQEELTNKSYKHGKYFGFYITDPKVRHIHKAFVRDRIVHHALYNILNPIFEPTFIADSYSCRKGFGTHRGFRKLVFYSRKVSRNYKRDCLALKSDMKKFFDSVDHAILFKIIKKRIKDNDLLWLIYEIINSYHTAPGKGIPIGNLTSQLFANIYLNELDYFAKHTLKIKYYIRYADDFVILDANKQSLEVLITPISQFLKNNLRLDLHPNKISFRKLDWGIDFLGYIVLPHYILPRTKTKKRIFQKLKIKINDNNFNQSLQSYLGYLGHANSFRLIQKLKNQIWLWSHI